MFKAFLFTCLSFLGPAEAHSRLEGQRIISSGKHRKFLLYFSAPIEVGFSQFHLESEKLKDPVRLTVLTLETRSREVSLSAPALDSGSYALRWTILSTDGHRQEGHRKMIVD